MRNSQFLNLVLPFVSMGLIYTTMLIGVYISSLNRGIACPDWPLFDNGM